MTLKEKIDKHAADFVQDLGMVLRKTVVGTHDGTGTDVYEFASTQAPTGRVLVIDRVDDVPVQCRVYCLIGVHS